MLLKIERERREKIGDRLPVLENIHIFFEIELKSKVFF